MTCRCVDEKGAWGSEGTQEHAMVEEGDAWEGREEAWPELGELSERAEVTRSVRRLREEKKEWRGVSIAVAGVLCSSTDATLVRWAASSGIELGAFLAWRFSFLAPVVLAWAAVDGQTPASAVGLKSRLGAGIVVTRALPDGLLAVAFRRTLAANVVLAFSLNPLWAALGGAAFLGDGLKRRTRLALVGACVGVVITFAPSASGGGDRTGDALAGAAGVAQAGVLLLARHAALTQPKLPLELAAGLGALFGAVVVHCYVAATSRHWLPPSKTSTLFAAVSVGALAIGANFAAMAAAPRYVPAATVGLAAVVVNSVCSPLWVFLAFDERPPLASVVGGLVLVLVMVAHQLAALRDVRAHRALLKRTAADFGIDTDDTTRPIEKVLDRLVPDDDDDTNTGGNFFGRNNNRSLRRAPPLFTSSTPPAASSPLEMITTRLRTTG